MSRYRLTPAAQIDLESIWDYTAETFGINQALIYTNGLESACALLADAPLINRPRPEYIPEVRIYPHAEHLLVYVISDGVVEIIRFLHSSMDVDSQHGTCWARGMKHLQSVPSTNMPNEAHGAITCRSYATMSSSQRV